MDGFDTSWPADSVEFCPHPLAQDIFVCGTYLLEQSNALAPEDTESPQQPAAPQKRRGECLVFQVKPEEDITLKQKLSFPAILDLKWCHADATTSPKLAIADSDGKINLLDLTATDERSLSVLEQYEVASENTLCLSLDWSNRRYPTSTLGSIVASLSDGSLTVLQPSDAGSLEQTDTWHAHDFEPWIAAWDYWDTNIVYSGGDDLKLKGWDMRDYSGPTFTNKQFDGGVTTIQSHPHLEHMLAVGSYDKLLRLFDTRSTRTPLASVDVGGGLWRVKWHPSPTRAHDLLAACMHDGCKVVRFAGDGTGDAQILTRFDRHESMAYGADWSFAPGKDGDDTLIASCSFYDHVLYTWRG